MNACVLTIGNELLQGFTVDTNSTWIGKKLLSYDIYVKKKISIPDEHDVIISETRKILNEKFDYFFITGGLGPTHDDVTKKAFCELFSDEIYLDENYLNELKNKFANKTKKFPEINKSQAMLLKKSEPIKNLHGSALGLHYIHEKTKLFIMPGVPFEMKHMMERTIIPKYINKKTNNNIISINTTGIMESQLAEKIEPLIKKYSNICNFAFLPSYKGVSFRLHFNKNSNKTNDIINEFNNKMKPYSYGFNDETLEYKVGSLLIKNKLTVATAESCTGGLIGKLLTDNPGSSKYFLGSITAYDNKLKTKLLGVPKEIIKSNGAVSEKVALHMVEGIRKNTQADIGISTTGISGPTGKTDQKPLGLVYIGLSNKNISKVKKFTFAFNRDIHRKITSYIALHMLKLMVENEN